MSLYHRSLLFGGNQHISSPEPSTAPNLSEHTVAWQIVTCLGSLTQKTCSRDCSSFHHQRAREKKQPATLIPRMQCSSGNRPLRLWTSTETILDLLHQVTAFWLSLLLAILVLDVSTCVHNISYFMLKFTIKSCCFFFLIPSECAMFSWHHQCERTQLFRCRYTVII